MCMVHLPQRLLDGYKSFIDSRYSLESSRYRTLADSGQKPRTMVIACCDSRAAPETIGRAGIKQVTFHEKKLQRAGRRLR